METYEKESCWAISNLFTEESIEKSCNEIKDETMYNILNRKLSKNYKAQYSTMIGTLLTFNNNDTNGSSTKALNQQRAPQQSEIANCIYYSSGIYQSIFTLFTIGLDIIVPVPIILTVLNICKIKKYCSCFSKNKAFVLIALIMCSIFQHSSSINTETASQKSMEKIWNGNIDNSSIHNATNLNLNPQELSWALRITDDIKEGQSDLTNKAKADINNSNIKYLNRHNILNIHNQHSYSNVDNSSDQQQQRNSTVTATESTKRDSANIINETIVNSGECYTCQRREKAKSDNLESIKRHILMRLQLTQLPNITKVPVVPQIILDNFYKSFYNNSATATTKIDDSLSTVPHHSAPPPSLSSSFSSLSTANNYNYNNNNNNNNNNKKHNQDNQNNNSNKRDYIELNDNQNPNVNKFIEYNSEKMQSDDPLQNDNNLRNANSIDNHNNWQNCNLWDIADEGLYSRLHSIYIFPSVSRLRHSRKQDMLNFKFNSDTSSIARAILHLYIRGHEWMQKYQPDLLSFKLPNGTMVKRADDIVVIVYRALKRPNAVNYTHTIKLVEVKHKIPPGAGQWIEIVLPQLPFIWLTVPNAKQSLVVKGQESWMRSFIVTDNWSNSKALMAHIEVVTQEKRRFKRSTSLDCLESDNEVRCCRYPLKVNFTHFGWNFIVAPTFFDAYFCNGECKAGYLEQYTHTHVASLTTSATPCCSPRKMKSLTLLYFNEHDILVQTTIPNMSVDKCSCS